MVSFPRAMLPSGTVFVANDVTKLKRCCRIRVANMPGSAATPRAGDAAEMGTRAEEDAGWREATWASTTSRGSIEIPRVAAMGKGEGRVSSSMEISGGSEEDLDVVERRRNMALAFSFESLKE